MKISIGCWVPLLLAFVYIPTLVAQTSALPTFPPGRDGVEEMIEYLLEANSREREAFTQTLRPTLEDCEAIFDGKLGKKVYKYQQKLKRQANIVVRPLLKDQTEYLLFQATTEELSDYQEEEVRNFPGGYHELADYLQPEVVFFRFKFVQPNRKLGSAYDVLVHVNGNWRLIHRPWVVLLKHGS